MSKRKTGRVRTIWAKAISNAVVQASEVARPPLIDRTLQKKMTEAMVVAIAKKITRLMARARKLRADSLL
jgi:hypothetical protein